ncbi:MAG: hypothetical protein JSV03_05820 [Planctomycetota bacterium]|nr:MAG: hypothetical protein JSV03_05820 [Planctomycetota bacterium]
MSRIKRRDFLQLAVAGGALCTGCNGSGNLFSFGPAFVAPATGMAPCLVSPGCRGSKVKVAKIYMANPKPMWPHPKLDVKAEVQKYEDYFASAMKDELADVDFVCSETVTSAQQMAGIKNKLNDVDGILAIHASWTMWPILQQILSVKRPTVLFAAPYSGHEWIRFGATQKAEEGALLECMLTSDFNQLAAAIRPFRAIHHLREAKILDVNARGKIHPYHNQINKKYGTTYKIITRDRMLKAYDAISKDDAEAEANRWMARAIKVVEPNKDEIIRSCRMGLAFKRLLDEEKATVMTVDCYGTMFQKLPAFPCIGFAMMNNLGLGGICESDIPSAVTHIIFQGLCGKPGFVNDPTMDVSNNSVILAHCLGSPKMDGPQGKAAPYKIRTIMERQQGAVIQAKMRIGQKVTTAELVTPDKLLYSTGTIIDVPDIDRACRTKITVKVDGCAEKLWKNWSHGLHRTTCYGDLTKDLKRFSRYMGVNLINEAV